MKVLKSTKIAIAFAAFVGGAYAAKTVITDRMVMGEKFAEISPTRLNIVGIDPGAGYRVIIANQVAQLVQRQGGFGADTSSGGGATEGSIKNRLPLSDMLKVLQGDEVALGRFVANLNEIREGDDWPPVRVVWPYARLKKALDGDPGERAKLEQDLNVKLDGTPLSEVRPTSIANGIITETPVKVDVNVNGTIRTMTGIVQQPYKPGFIRRVEAAYAEKPNVDQAMIKGYYLEEARKTLKGPGQKEDIAGTLADRISERTSKKLAEKPMQILRYAKVVINDAMITDAHYQAYDSAKGKLYDLTMDLTDEGRRRLWQFSKTRVGNQLLVVADGVGIAAPVIDHELAMGELTVTQLPDDRLLRNAVEIIKARSSK